MTLEFKVVAFLGAIFCFVLISLLWKWASSNKIESSADDSILQDLPKKSNDDDYSNPTLSSLIGNIYNIYHRL